MDTVSSKRDGLAAGDLRAAGGSWRAIGKAGDIGENTGGVDVHCNVDVGVVREQAGRADAGNADEAARAGAAILAEQQVFAVRCVGDASVAAVTILSRGR